MRLIRSMLLIAVLIAPRLQAQEIQNGDFTHGLEGWTIDIPKTAQPLVTVSPDAADGKPALRIEIRNDVDKKTAWKGKLQQTVTLPAPGSYTVTFMARVEPSDEKVIMIATKSDDHPLGSVVNFDLTLEWQEFTYNLVAEENNLQANLIWRNLASTGRTFFFSNIRISKD